MDKHGTSVSDFKQATELTSSEQLGFPQQLELFNNLKKQNLNFSPIVIDSKDILFSTYSSDFFFFK